MKSTITRNRIALTLTTLGVVAMVLALFGPQLRSAVATIWEFGDVFAGISSGNYNVYSNAGVFKQTINNGTSGYTTGCAYNSSATQLYTTDFSGGRVVKFADADPHGSSSFPTTGQNSPESFVFKKDGGYFVGGPSAAVILEYDAADNLVTTHQVAATDFTGGTDWIDLAANQTTLFYTGEGRAIKRFDTVAGQLSDFATLPNGNAFAFRLLPPFDGSGGLIVADGVNVKRLDAGGNVIQTYSVSGVSDFFALNLDPDGKTFWTGSINNGVLYRFDIATGGADNYIQTISTATAPLYGVCVKGEITGGGATNCVNPPGGMVAWWPGDGNAADIVGGNHGTAENGATFSTGMVAQAFSLNGTQDIFIGNPNALRITGSITLDAWVNPSTVPPNNQLMSIVTKWFSEGVSGDSYGLFLSPDESGNLFLLGAISEPNSEDPGMIGGTRIPLNTWTHVAMTYDATTGENILYVNGVLDGVRTRTGGILDSTTNVYIGRQDDTDFPRFFSGEIDEVEIFNRVLRSDEILSIFNANSFGKCKPAQTDVKSAFVNKNETFVQTTTNDPTGENGTPFQLVVGVEATAPNNITSASFTPPGRSVTPLTSSDAVNYNFFSTNFPDLTSFNAAFPNGDYAFDISTAHAPFLLTPIIPINGDSYPAMPKILNTSWSSGALQIADPTQSFTFQWNTFYDCGGCNANPTGASGQQRSAAATNTSYITLRIADTSDNVVLEQSFPDTTTSYVMPANTLQQGQTYHAQLQFANLNDRNENGMQLSGQYASITKFDIVTLVPRPPAVCSNGHTYMLTAAAESWTQAEAEAVSKGGHLVAINSADEQSFLIDHFLTGRFLLQPLWIGLTDQQKEGKFVWTTPTSKGRGKKGNGPNYTNWNLSTHEPNDCCNPKIKHEEDYVCMNWHYARNGTDPIGTWNDVQNNGTVLDGNAHGPYFGIIEVPDCAQ